MTLKIEADLPPVGARGTFADLKLRTGDVADFEHSASGPYTFTFCDYPYRAIDRHGEEISGLGDVTPWTLISRAGPGLSPHPEADDAPAVDLTAITTPFGLLDEATQEALRAHGGPYEILAGVLNAEWCASYGDDLWYACRTYRARPAPKVTEHVLYWEARRGNAFHTLRDGDTHRITLRHTGDTLPSGTYTGPDGATITVEGLS